jgi:hypothetical protein
MRKFEYAVAVRKELPLLIGIFAPSGGGKTYSSLRLATGISRVCGGEVALVDTEARRALHYADTFAFKHVPFAPPHGPLDYVSVIEHCVNKGAKTIIVDSLSNEHEGQGGVLEIQQAEEERLSAQWGTSRDKVKMASWIRPKQERRKLMSYLRQAEVNLIICFRAREKMDASSKKPVKLGYMPIAGDEFLFEMTTNVLLLPGSDGVPTWRPDEPGERAMVKLPEQFRSIFSGRTGPLDEATGEAMARWAAGDRAPKEAPVEESAAPTISPDAETMRLGILACQTPDRLAELLPRLREFEGDDREVLRSAYKARVKELQ